MTLAMTNPQTSFVIASRNRCAELTATVERLLDTTACPIIVVDNASDDESLIAVGRLSARSGSRLLLVALDRNLGAVGRNVGVGLCATKYVAFCDDDSWWQPDAPGIAEDVFARYPTVGLLAARTVVMPQGIDDPLVRLLAGSPLGTRRDLPGPSVLGFLACSSIVRVEAFNAVGGFSPVLHFRGEEQLLALDMAAHGWDLCYCAELVAMHQPSQSRPASSAQDARSLRNAVLTTWLRRPAGHCVRSAAALARSAVRDTEHARAAAEAAARLPRVLVQRRRLPEPVELAARLLERGPATAPAVTST
ncbi:glycosyltransferase [Mycolicibacterium sp.]|uniref:glycosyltransferase family 2 protein n=1 Tax=Mycolicibacterium sp. TaxID=2320850 RepID=UPI0028AA930E|nr:glycosyltransferase [Mycolicibacterium sp.]